MFPPPLIPLGLTCLAMPLFMGSIACESSQLRDRSYGTDAGAGYRAEAAVFTKASEDALDSHGASDAALSQSLDSPAAPEAVDAPDAPDLPEATDVAEAADAESDADVA